MVIGLTYRYKKEIYPKQEIKKEKSHDVLFFFVILFSWRSYLVRHSDFSFGNVG
jgi:hypothetical protein